MTKISFKEPTDSEWEKWKKKCKRKQSLHSEAIQKGKVSKITKLYKEQKKIYRDKNGPFKGKCAYCENEDLNLHIDHFRPKESVSDESWVKVKVRFRRKIQNHPGYYWLVYNFKNFLPACHTCNSRNTDTKTGKVTGKLDRFPVLGEHSIKPGSENNENHLLINPIYENPKKYFKLNDLGCLVPKGKKGKTTIDILGLNLYDRPESRIERYDAVRNKMGMIGLAIGKRNNSKEILTLKDEIKKIKDGHGNFTIAALKAIKDYDRAIINELRL